MNITFSNPRLRAEFADWPSGGRRVPCVFQVERKAGKWRVSRTTTGKSKTTTYGGAVCIVDGSDGKTYILQDSVYGFINIRRFDFLDASVVELGRRGVVTTQEDPVLHAELTKLIADGGALEMEE